MNQNRKLSAAGLLVKQAAPRYIELLRKGLLSDAAASRIATAMPAGSFRGMRVLGRGVEGKAIEGLIGGGVGPGVLKTFNQMEWPWWRKLYDKLARPMLASPAERMRVMAERPDLFPVVHGTHPRGFMMEKLKEIGPKGPGAMESMLLRGPNDKAYTLGDYSFESGHNIMARATGKKVISDPSIQGPLPVPGWLSKFLLKNFAG